MNPMREEIPALDATEQPWSAEELHVRSLLLGAEEQAPLELESRVWEELDGSTTIPNERKWSRWAAASLAGIALAGMWWFASVEGQREASIDEPHHHSLQVGTESLAAHSDQEEKVIEVPGEGLSAAETDLSVTKQEVVESRTEDQDVQPEMEVLQSLHVSPVNQSAESLQHQLEIQEEPLSKAKVSGTLKVKE